MSASKLMVCAGTVLRALLSRDRVSLALAVTLLCSIAPAATAEKPDAVGHWEGAITGLDMISGFRLDLSRNDAEWQGELKVALWGEKVFRAEPVSVDGSKCVFSVRHKRVEYVFSGTVTDAEFSGEWKQGDRTGMFRLWREPQVDSSSPRRPQTPLAPSRYKEVELKLKSKGATLAGVLVVPDGFRKGELAILIPSGNGPWDRDYTYAGHELFHVVAHALALQGIASVRLDERGAGDSTGSKAKASLDDLAADIAAVTGFIKTREELSGCRVGIIAHGMGSVVAMKAIEQNKDLYFLVSLAPVVLDWKSNMETAEDLVGRSSGSRAEEVANRKRFKATVLDEISKGSTDEQIESVARTAHQKIFGSDEMSDWAATYAKKVSSPFNRDVLQYNASRELARGRVSTLVLFAERDHAAPATPNYRELRRLIGKTETDRVELDILPETNHVFQSCIKGLQDEIPYLSETISTKVLDRVVSWIQDLK